MAECLETSGRASGSEIRTNAKRGSRLSVGCISVTVESWREHGDAWCEVSDPTPRGVP